jgi:hypothetical protein
MHQGQQRVHDMIRGEGRASFVSGEIDGPCSVWRGREVRLANREIGVPRNCNGDFACCGIY